MCCWLSGKLFTALRASSNVKPRSNTCLRSDFLKIFTTLYVPMYFFSSLILLTISGFIKLFITCFGLCAGFIASRSMLFLHICKETRSYCLRFLFCRTQSSFLCLVRYRPDRNKYLYNYRFFCFVA